MQDLLELIGSDLRPFLQLALVAILGIAVFIWGRGPEKAIYITWVVVFEIIGRVYRYAFDVKRQLVEIDPFMAVADCVVCVIWIAIALNANRVYPLWLAGLQIVAVLAHVARGMTDVISPIAYGVMVIAPGWMQLFILGFGVLRHVQRKAQFGTYRDWRVPVKWGGLLPARQDYEHRRAV